MYVLYHSLILSSSCLVGMSFFSPFFDKRQGVQYFDHLGGQGFHEFLPIMPSSQPLCQPDIDT